MGVSVMFPSVQEGEQGDEGAGVCQIILGRLLAVRGVFDNIVFVPSWKLRVERQVAQKCATVDCSKDGLELAEQNTVAVCRDCGEGARFDCMLPRGGDRRVARQGTWKV